MGMVTWWSGTSTPEHPFYTAEGEWVPAAALLARDQVRKADGSFGTVEGVASVQQPRAMYNLTVDQVHTFFVGDGQWLVHNRCSPARTRLCRGKR
jgi:hypothetical protein